MQLLAHSALLKALGWCLLNSIWQMAFLWLVYFAINNIRRNNSASAKHNLAAVLLCAGFLWFVLSFAISYSDLRQSGYLSVFSIVSWSNSLMVASNIRSLVDQVLPYCACLYLLVLAFQFVQYSRNYHDSRKLTREGLYKTAPDLRLFGQEIAHRLGIHKNVKIYLSSLADSPMTIGFLKYVILIPLATINNLSTLQVEAILLHELAHIKRNDYLLNLLLAVVDIVFFFNPFSRLFIHVIKKERENSCDDLVMQFNYDPHVYVMALLSLEKSRHKYNQLAIAAIGKNNDLLLQRVRRITGQKAAKQQFRPRLIPLFMISLILCGLLSLQFKIIDRPSEGATASTQTKKISPATDNILPVLRAVLTIPNDKNDRTRLHVRSKDRSGSRPEESLDEYAAESETPATAAEEESGDVQVPDNGVAVVRPEAMDFSIQTPNTNTVIDNGNLAHSDYPFVPSSSFSFQTTQDPDLPVHATLSPEATDDHKLMVRSFRLVNSFDMKQVEKLMTLTKKDIAVNLRKIKTEIQGSVKPIDWEKISDEVSTSANELESIRIKSDIQIQLHALQDLKADQQKSAKLKGEILENQLKLQQNYLLKQQELLKKIKETKRRSKIVYI